MSTIRLTKTEVARRNLESAVHLYFNSGDPVSIHVLAWAAYEVIGKVSKHRGGQPTFFNSIVDNPAQAKDKRKKISKMLRGARNFFEHAGKDPSATLDFDPEISDWVLSDAILHHMILSEEIVPSLAVYTMWNASLNGLIPDAERMKPLQKLFGMAYSVSGGNRKKYFDLAMPIAGRIKYRLDSNSIVYPASFGALILDAVGQQSQGAEG
jgi:hypothetical protein